MISIKNLSKYFNSNQALKKISLEIIPGEIVGFLGPNAAGKTTLMRILTSYLSFEEGEVTLFGYDVRRDPLAVRRKIGYLPETPPLYREMTVKSYLKLAAELKDVPHRQLASRIEKTLQNCDIMDVKDQTIGRLSKGYQQRVGIAQAIIHDPELLILDEPTNGLDPLQIIQIRKLIQNLEKKRTVIVSTHILPEIEQIAKRVVIIRQGTIVADQSLSSLLSDERSKETAQNKIPTLENIFLRLTA